MTKFKRPVRYDPTTAFDGVWFDIEDEMGNEYGSFKCALVDVGSPRWIATVERLQREEQGKRAIKGQRQEPKRSKKEKQDDEVRQFVSNFVEMALLDWAGIFDEDGKEVPFSKDAAIEYFDINDPTAMFVSRLLTQRASDVTNFQPADQEGLPEGN